MSASPQQQQPGVLRWVAGFLNPYRGRVLAALLFLLLLLLSLFLLPRASLATEHNSEPVRFSVLLKNGVLLRFMLAALLLQVSFAPFYGFFTLYSRDLGYSGTQTGLFIALSIVAEIIAFYFAGSCP